MAVIAIYQVLACQDLGLVLCASYLVNLHKISLLHLQMRKQSLHTTVITWTFKKSVSQTGPLPWYILMLA